MMQALLCGGLAVVSFAAAAALVLAIARVTGQLDARAGARADGPAAPASLRTGSAAEPAWWPEFERAFADYVHRSGAGSRDWRRPWRSRR